MTRTSPSGSCARPGRRLRTGSRALAGVLNNLGVALWSRSAHRPADLPEALAAFEQAVAITPAEVTRRRQPTWTTSRTRSATGTSRPDDQADLDQAVQAYERAISCLPESAPERLRIRANLAVCLLTRYRENGRRETAGAADLERAVAELTESSRARLREPPPW